MTARRRQPPSEAERDAGVEDLIALVVGVDGILQAQAKADAAYFSDVSAITDTHRREQVEATVLKTCRWQYIVSGVMEPRLQKLLGSLVSEAQVQRILGALGPLMYALPADAKAAASMAH